MITKKITPIGMVGYSDADKGKKEMKVSQMVVEYRFLGILLYKKILVMPRHFGADFCDELIFKF